MIIDTYTFTKQILVLLLLQEASYPIITLPIFPSFGCLHFIKTIATNNSSSRVAVVDRVAQLPFEVSLRIFSFLNEQELCKEYPPSVGDGMYIIFHIYLFLFKEDMFAK